MRSDLAHCRSFLWKDPPVHCLEQKSPLFCFSPTSPFCDLSVLFTALCPLDLELQVLALYKEDRKCLVSVDIIVYTFSSTNV